MNIKVIYIGTALALSAGGIAFAGALDVYDPLATRPFSTGSIQAYTGSTSKAKFKATFMAMPKAKREKIMKKCQDAAMSKPYAEFCGDLNALAGS
ncbi:hypothetical protein NKJ73_19240 [Mesorhizobium sp. M0074]|uniref:hypothetical protein n=1 Tax=Mesorhizobium sp. M0074 TaxID=2956869 RepID=UPI0033392E80